jgi:hypothetical protein
MMLRGGPPRPNPGGVVTILFFFMYLGLVGAGCRYPGETTETPSTSLIRKSTMLTQDEAIEVARRAIAGKVELQKGSHVTVERKGDAYVVTFVRIDPPGTRGPDYDARVTIDADTGKVTELLGG